MTASSSGIPQGPELLEGRPALAAALHGPHAQFRLAEEDFEHGLTLLLDGMERHNPHAPDRNAPDTPATRPGHTAASSDA